MGGKGGERRKEKMIVTGRGGGRRGREATAREDEGMVNDRTRRWRKRWGGEGEEEVG